MKWSHSATGAVKKVLPLLNKVTLCVRQQHKLWRLWEQVGERESPSVTCHYGRGELRTCLLHSANITKLCMSSHSVLDTDNRPHFSFLPSSLLIVCATQICEVRATLPLLLLFVPPSVLFFMWYHHPRAATHSPSHPHNITWHATQGRSMIPALFLPSVLAIRLLPFPISPLGPLSVTYIRSFHFQWDDRAIKWTASDRQRKTSSLAVSPLSNKTTNYFFLDIFRLFQEKQIKKQKFLI